MFVLIGGGEIRTGETRIIDQEIVRSSGKITPNHLFIPTASSEPVSYIETVAKVYSSLGCNTESLCILNGQLTKKEIEQKLDWADIIYVGGGNTRMMISAWEKYGLIDSILSRARGDKIFSGLSAGSICWCHAGVSDSNSFDENQDWGYSLVNGLGLIPIVHSPHLDERFEEEKFRKFLCSQTFELLGIENNCSLFISGMEYRVVRSQEGKNAFKIECQDGSFKKQILPDSGQLIRKV